MKRIVAVIFSLFLFVFVEAQTTPNPRPITMHEYQKAKTFLIKDLDKDTYVKFENAYVLDRYEMRKPYFITGDDGLRKRIDLYKLIAKDGMQELGTAIFYTNEKGKIYNAVQPNFTADAKVWEQYFNDIDNINKEEKNFILKLSYVLSKEMSFQLYKAINKGKDLKDESATYGTDICFPGDQKVLMADGSQKALAQIKTGDKIISFDPITNKTEVASVKELVAHPAKNYAVTRLLLLSAKEENNEVYLSAKIIEATPNHPVTTNTEKRIGDVQVNEQMTCWDETFHSYKTYTVISKEEKGKGTQKVYNMVVDKGSTFVMNDVLVMQK